MAITLKPLQCLTNAPEDYDYGWMRTVAYNVATDKRGRALRLAQNEDQWHFEQQVMRYGSGLNLTYDTQKNLDDALKYNLLVENADPTPVYYHSVSLKALPTITTEDFDRVYHIACRIQEFAPEPDYKVESRNSETMIVRIVGTALNESFLTMLNEYGLKPTGDEFHTPGSEGEDINLKTHGDEAGRWEDQ